MKIGSVFVRSSAVFLCILTCFALLTACKPQNDTPVEINRIRIVMGDNQCALPNEKFSNPIRVEVLGEKKGGFSLFRKSD